MPPARPRSGSGPSPLVPLGYLACAAVAFLLASGGVVWLAPEVTRRRLYYETMESVLGQTDKTIVESGGVTPYLPLPEVRRRAQQAATPAAPPAGGR